MLRDKTLGECLGDPRIRPIASDAIRAMNLSRKDFWNKTLADIRDNWIFMGEVDKGFERLYRAADTGDWYYPLYSEAECKEDKTRKGVNLVWFPSDAKEADERPFILLVPGGGFVNVWNLTEGWPVADKFNREGYHVFILTYRVKGEEGLLEKELDDFTRALETIRDKAGHFHVDPDRYITCGFSAGGYLIGLWNTNKGYPARNLPKPQASFPVYPVVSLRSMMGYWKRAPKASLRLYGCPIEEAVESEFEIPEHAETFPPCAIFAAENDDLAGNARMLAAALDALKIPCRLEIGEGGCHGFADGTGMSMEGWISRAVRWYESL